MRSPVLKAHAPDLQGEWMPIDDVQRGDAVRSEGNWWCVILINKSWSDNVALRVKQLDKNGNIAADGGGFIGDKPGTKLYVAKGHIHPADLD